MGLPLFVASDKASPAKASGKDGILAPSRSAIRRQPPSRDRVRHINDTRQAALRALAISPPYLPPALERYSGGSFPWNNSEPSVDPERRSPSLHPPSLQPPDPLRSVTRDTDGIDWWPAESQSSADSQPRSRRARIIPPMGSRQPNPNRRLRPRAINSPPPPLPGPSRLARPLRGMDGLGDRDRSLSPEVWDTLQTTVTPDPQPPSAGSSFASAAASHLEGPFSGRLRHWEAAAAANASTNSSANADTNTITITHMEGPDMACESGGEGEESGAEAPDFEDYHRHMRRRRAELRLRSLRAPNFNSFNNFNADPIAAGDADAHHLRSRAIYQQQRLLSRIARAGGLPQVEPMDPLSASPSGDETETDEAERSRQAGGEAGGENFTGAETGARDAQDAQGTTTTTPPPGEREEEEWIGLQRVMRSLAAREEMVDEMWAEVGLLRTLFRPEETS